MKGKTDSKGELAIHQSLTSKNILHKLQYKIKGKSWKYDFYFPQFNLLVELNGNQHYEYVDYFHKNYKGGFEGYKQNDIAKRRFAENKGYKYYEIDYRKHNPKEARKEIIQIIQKLRNGQKIAFPKYQMPIKEIPLRNNPIKNVSKKEIPVEKKKKKKEKQYKITFESYDDNKMYSRNMGNFY